MKPRGHRAHVRRARGTARACGIARAALALSVAAGASTAGEARADAETERPLALGGFVGGNYISDQVELGNAYFAEQVPGSAFLLGARGSYELLSWGGSLAPRLSAEAELKLALSSTGAAPGSMRSSYFAPVLGWRAQAVLDLWSEYRAHPHVSLGFGGETVFSSSPFVASGDSDATMYWGVGGSYALASSYGVRADLRLGITAGRFDASASTVELQFGFYYAFGPGEPAAPRTRRAEPVPYALASEPVDEDDDGVPDFSDACPSEPELYNRMDDEDGCPERDPDGDGLFGAADECPEEAEDFEGFEDEDGCPDVDNDGDGNPDSADECPNRAETDNGFEDEDGCPDEVPTRVAEYIGVLEGIRFPSGSAKIRDRRSRRILGDVAATLAEYPSVRVRISGHTDDRGRAEKNVQLSRERADAVKWFLVDKGIEHTRIVTAGYGPERPLADNGTRAGRAKNRRIEFELLTGPIEIEANPADADADEASE